MSEHFEKPVPHAQAAESAHRLINSLFRRRPEARAQIPAHPADDDLVITRYIGQQEQRDRTLRQAVALLHHITIWLNEYYVAGAGQTSYPYDLCEKAAAFLADHPGLLPTVARDGGVEQPGLAGANG